MKKRVKWKMKMKKKMMGINHQSKLTKIIKLNQIISWIKFLMLNLRMIMSKKTKVQRDKQLITQQIRTLKKRVNYGRKYFKLEQIFLMKEKDKLKKEVKVHICWITKGHQQLISQIYPV